MEVFDKRSTYTITLDTDPNVHNVVEQATGVQSRWFSSGETLTSETDLNPAAVFMDVRMGVEGTQNGQLIPKLKDNWPLCPIILTAGADDSEVITEAVALGADDFVGKPLVPTELSSRFNVRCRALRRRAARETISVADLTIDTLQRSVSSVRGQKYLSPTEIRLISELAKSSGSVVPRDILKKRCWPQTKVSDNALNRKLYEVRKRLKPLSDGISIRTIYGVGFILEERD